MDVIIPLILRCIFAIPINNLTRLHNERMVLIPVMLLSAVLLNAYLAGLYNIIETGVRRRRMTTLDEFSRSEIPLLAVRQGMNEYFQNRPSKMVRELGKNIRFRKEIHDDLFERHAYVMREKEFYFLLETKSIRRDLYMINEKVLSFTMAYVVRRGSPFLGPLSSFTTRVFEAGLQEKWYSMTVNRVNEVKEEQEQHTVVDGPVRRPLSPSDVEVAFFSLIVGKSISSLVFILELIVKYFVVRKSRRVNRNYTGTGQCLPYTQ